MYVVYGETKLAVTTLSSSSTPTKTRLERDEFAGYNYMLRIHSFRRQTMLLYKRYHYNNITTASKQRFDTVVLQSGVYRIEQHKTTINQTNDEQTVPAIHTKQTINAHNN